MSAVTLNNFTKSYGSLNVLKDINLAIESGEFIALVGPSGCGKSTLLRMIAGLEEVTSGTLSIGSRIVNAIAPKDRNIAMVFQSYALYPHFSVEANMGFGLKLRGNGRKEIRSSVGQVAAMLGLDQFLDRLPKALSGGQRQRVAMGRAIVRRPEVFLFDEPLSNLDAKLRVQMRSEIKSLHQEIGTTSIYVTHDQIEAMTMASRIVVMNGGRIEQVGAPLEIYDRPACAFVAGFIGSPSMNFLEADYRNLGSTGAVRLGPDTVVETEQLPGLDQATVTLGIRPEHLVLNPDDPGMAALSAEVDVVEPTGLATILYLSAGGRRLCLHSHQRPDVHPGDRISIGFPKGKLHLFCPLHGHRLN